MKDQPVDINATLTYLSDLPVYENEKLFEIWADNAPTELPRTNTEFTEHGDVLIEDLRYRPIQPDLDSTGFTFLKHESACLPRAEDMLAAEPTEMLYQYLEEVIELIKELLQADKVLCFDWRYRKNQPRQYQNQLYENKPPAREQSLNVASIIHSDDSQHGGVLKLQRYLTEREWKEFSEGKWRVRFINIWRPIITEVQDAPLAFCDRRSVRKEDFLEVDKVHEEYLGENNYLKFHQSQRWYYLSQQKTSEPSIFVTWDSSAGKLPHPAGPPHTSFANAKAAKNCPPRESIEVRTIVMHHKDN